MSSRIYDEHIRFVVSRDKQVLDLDGERAMTGDLDLDGNDLNNVGALSVKGNTTLGDASGDTVTVNAATVTFANAETFTLKDNNATALKIGSTGATSLLVVDTSDSAEAVTVSGLLNANNVLATAAVAGVAGKLALGYDTLRTAGSAAGNITLKANNNIASVATYMKVYHNNTAYYIPMIASDPQTV